MTEPEETKECRTCGWSLPLECFGFDTKNGKRYRRHKCNDCRNFEHVNRDRMAAHREFNLLARWPAPTNQE